MKNQYRGGNCLKRGGPGQFADLGGGGGGKKEGDGVFEGGWYPNAHYVVLPFLINYELNFIHNTYMNSWFN